MSVLFVLYQIVEMIANIVIMLVLIQFVIGLLFAFNVVDRRNEFLGGFYEAINRLLEPVLGPIRRILPATGMLDFAPLVLIVVLNIILIVLSAILSGAA